MTSITTIAKNSFFLITAKAICMILNFFYVTYTARYLGVEAFGILSFALSFAAISSILLSMGFDILTAREVSRDKKLGEKYIGNIVPIQLLLSVLVIGLVSLIVNYSEYPAETIHVIYLIVLSTVFNSYSTLFQSISQAFEKMEYVSYGQILNSILMIIGTLVSIKENVDVVVFGYTYFIVNLIVLVYSYLFCLKKFVNPRYEINLDFWRGLITESLPFSLTVIISVLFFHIDILMLSIMKGNEIVGAYRAACNIIIMIISIADVFVYVIFPAASLCYITSKESLEVILEKLSKYLFIMGLPFGIGIILLANEIIECLYGFQFISATVVIKILGLYIPFRFISHATGWTLASINKEPLRTFSAFIAIFINIILNILLIPKYGISGAAVATVISQIILFVLYFYFVGKYFHRLQINSIIIKPLISSVFMGIFIISQQGNNLFLTASLSTIVYFLVLYLIKGFDEGDKKIFNEIMAEIRNKSYKINKNC